MENPKIELNNGYMKNSPFVRIFYTKNDTKTEARIEKEQILDIVSQFCRLVKLNTI